MRVGILKRQPVWKTGVFFFGGGGGKTGEGRGKGREVVHFMKFFQLPEGF